MSTFQDFRAKVASSTIVHVAFAFLMMGGWAMFANRAHPLPEALQAGVLQGTISGVLTLCLKKFLEWMSGLFFRAPASDEGIGKPIAALIVPPIITASAILGILFTAHTLAGTPEVVATIAFPFAVSTTYAILYNLSLWKRHDR